MPTSSGFRRLLLVPLALLALVASPLRAQDWVDSDIGNTGATGSSGIDDSGLFSFEGAGTGVGGSSDAFNFTYKLAAGDQTITTRLTQFSPADQTQSQIGVMVRNTLDASAPNVFLTWTSAGVVNLVTRTKGGAAAKTKSLKVKTTTLPVWLRLQMDGKDSKVTVKAFTSLDGIKWSSAGNTTLPTSGSYYMGFAIASHATGVLATAQADQVSLAIPGQPLYTLTRLGTLGGAGTTSVARGLNAQGVIVGASSKTSGGSNFAFRNANGVMTDIGAGAGSVGVSVNTAGWVAGTYLSSGILHGFLWNGSVFTPLTAPVTQSDAEGVNASGQVVGSYYVGPIFSHAFLYSSGVFTDLGTLGGDTSAARAINDAGMVTGVSTLNNGRSTGFFYDKGRMSNLGTLGGSSSAGNAINATGQVTGNSWLRNDSATHAFVTRAKGNRMMDLGTLGGTYSTGLAINDKGQVVGESSVPTDDTYAFLYDPKLGMINLSNSLTTYFPYTLYSANGINSSGQIIGLAEDGDGNNFSFLLTPSGTMK